MTFLAELKERPEEERVAFATTMAVAVVVLLITSWIATIFLRSRSVAQSEEANKQTASAMVSFGSVVNKANNTINSVTDQYRELQGKTGPVGAGAYYATSTIREAAKNFMKIRYDKEGNMYIEDGNSASLLDFPYQAQNGKVSE